MKNAKRRFKLRFLPSYAAKSRFQRLRECGNGRGTRWNREIREEWCLDRSIWIDFNSDAYKTWRTSLFIGGLIVTVRSKRSTVTINGPRWTVFQNFAIVGLKMDGPDAPWFCVLKRIRSRSLDHDRAVQMRSTPFHLDRYNASQFDTCSDRDPVVRAPRDRRASIDRPPNPTFSTRPRHLRLIKGRGLVPHGK